MKRISKLLFMILLSFNLLAQEDFNLSLVANLKYNENIKDIWGFVDANGIEYAAVGTNKATIIISLAEPAQATEVAYILGVNTSWRDIKSYDNYIYSIADGISTKDGLLVVDMSQAPEIITHQFINPEIIINGDTTVLEACHNLFIDENGYGYLAGCNVNAGGVLFFDFFTDPFNPKFIAAGDPRYSHDIFVRGDTMWSSDIYSDFFSVTDVRDKQNPILMATQSTSFSFTHNAWLSDDGKYLFTTDELPDAFIDAYDVSDLNDIKRLDQYRPTATLGTGVIPHNVHYHNGYLVISNYSDGVKIVDAHKPDNLIEVASFDTYPDDNAGTNGCWGVYPYLPSGLVLASDQSYGIFVLQANYQRACYLEGNIRDEETDDFLPGVQIKISSDAVNLDFSDSFGQYKTGQVAPGTYQAEFSLPGYESKSVTINLSNGSISNLNITLKKVPRFRFSGLTLRSEDDQALVGAKVALVGEVFSYETISDNQGRFQFEEVILGNYDIYIGKWGAENIVINKDIDQIESTVARLKKGYRDDFIVDQGWVISGDASKGIWEIGEPKGTIFDGNQSNPEFDLEKDWGEFCLMTGNGGSSVGFDDVDNGRTIISSPKIDLSLYQEPVISYYYWFYNASGFNDPNDTLKVFLSDGNDTIRVQAITESSSEWSERVEHTVADYFPEADSLTIIFETADLPGSGNLVEAAIDLFLVSNGTPTNANTPSDPMASLTVAPNPFFNEVLIQYELKEDPQNAQLLISNLLGQPVRQIPILQKSGKLNLGRELIPGIYFIQLKQDGKINQSLKIIKSQ